MEEPYILFEMGDYYWKYEVSYYKTGSFGNLDAAFTTKQDCLDWLAIEQRAGHYVGYNVYFSDDERTQATPDK